jgi:hypothetical protein
VVAIRRAGAIGANCDADRAARCRAGWRWRANRWGCAVSDAQRLIQSVFSSVREFFDQPHIKAYYAAEAKKNAAIAAREAREAQAKRDAAAAEKQRAKSYDAYVLNGGGDECMRFGIMDGCKPWCPVFECGKCEMQEEVEALFAGQSPQRVGAGVQTGEVGE